MAGKQHTVTPEAQELRAVFGRNLRETCKIAGLSLNALARDANVSRSHMLQVLHGNTNCSLDWLAQVAVVLAVEPWTLLVETLPADEAADTE